MWYRMCDTLGGTITVGVAYDKTTDWTVPFGEYDQFLFGTYNLEAWMYLPRSSTRGHSNRGDNNRPVYSSSNKPYWHTPVIRITEWDSGRELPFFDLTGTAVNRGQIIYKEGMRRGSDAFLTWYYSGMGVWV